MGLAEAEPGVARPAIKHAKARSNGGRAWPGCYRVRRASAGDPGLRPGLLDTDVSGGASGEWRAVTRRRTRASGRCAPANPGIQRAMNRSSGCRSAPISCLGTWIVEASRPRDPRQRQPATGGLLASPLNPSVGAKRRPRIVRDQTRALSSAIARNSVLNSPGRSPGSRVSGLTTTRIRIPGTHDNVDSAARAPCRAL